MLIMVGMSNFADRCWSTSTGFIVGLTALSAWQATNSLVSLNGIIVLQRPTPHHLQGRVNTTARMVAWGGTPFGAALGGVLAESIGIGNALLVAGTGVLFALICGLATSLRRAKPLNTYAASDSAPDEL